MTTISSEEILSSQDKKEESWAQVTSKEQVHENNDHHGDNNNNNERQDDDDQQQQEENDEYNDDHDQYFRNDDEDEDDNGHPHYGHDHNDGGKVTSMPFYRPPRQRQRWSDNQLAPHTEWGDIFFDLFYVATAYKLGNLLREDPTSRGLLFLLGCFFPIMGLWTSKMFYTSRFYVVDDIFHRLFEVATLIPLAMSILHIRTVPILSDPQHYVDIFAFTLSITIGILLNLTRSVEVMICQHFWNTDGLFPEAYYAGQRDLIFGVPSLAFALAATIYSGQQYYGYKTDSGSDATGSYKDDDGNHRIMADAKAGGTTNDEDDIAIWLSLAGPISNLVLMFSYILLAFRGSVDFKKYTVPMNIDYSIHRYGEWTMLLLGESVLSLLIVTLSEGYDYYKTFFSGVITVILLQVLHFQSQPHDPDNHALRRSRPSALSFTLAMWVYSAALIVLGTAYKMFLYEFVYVDSVGQNDHRSLFLSSPDLRFLAGGESSALRFETSARRQRIAHFFSGSMALVWFCLDVTILTHNGIQSTLGRLWADKSTKGATFLAYVVIFLRIGSILFIATVSQYTTYPSSLAFIGMAGVVFQLILRVLLSLAFPPDIEEKESEAIERVAHHLNARIRS